MGLDFVEGVVGDDAVWNQQTTVFCLVEFVPSYDVRLAGSRGGAVALRDNNNGDPWLCKTFCQSRMVPVTKPRAWKATMFLPERSMSRLRVFSDHIQVMISTTRSSEQSCVFIKSSSATPLSPKDVSLAYRSQSLTAVQEFVSPPHPWFLRILGPQTPVLSRRFAAWVYTHKPTSHTVTRGAGRGGMVRDKICRSWPMTGRMFSPAAAVPVCGFALSAADLHGKSRRHPKKQKLERCLALRE